MNKRALLEYFKSSYFAVDGLWFVKVEESSSFENALDIDEKVWEVLPKIQARKLKEVKFEGEEYEYDIMGEDNVLEIAISRCPWQEIMKRGGREHLAAQVGDRVCATELNVWAKEFGASFAMESKMCQGAESCTLRFESTD